MPAHLSFLKNDRAALYPATVSGVPVLADKGHQGTGTGVYTPIKSRGLEASNSADNALLTSMHTVGERAKLAEPVDCRVLIVDPISSRRLRWHEADEEHEEQLMQYHEFLASVADHGGPADREHAEKATRTVLENLGKRLAGNEPRDLASQLPSELQQPLLRHNGERETGDDLDAFLRRVAEHEGRGCDPEQALAHARAVLSTMASFVSAGEIADLRSQLPAGFAPLFE